MLLSIWHGVGMALTSISIFCWHATSFLLPGLCYCSRPGAEQFPVSLGSAIYCSNLCVYLYMCS